MRLLVVDDDTAILRIVALALSRQGHSASCASDGKSALEAARRERLDGVLLDLGLPDMEGILVCRHLKRRGIPVILMTAGMDEEVQAALAEGAAGMIRKPFEYGTLGAVVEALLAKAR